MKLRYRSRSDVVDGVVLGCSGAVCLLADLQFQSVRWDLDWLTPVVPSLQALCGYCPSLEPSVLAIPHTQPGLVAEISATYRISQTSSYSYSYSSAINILIHSYQKHVFGIFWCIYIYLYKTFGISWKYQTEQYRKSIQFTTGKNFFWKK